MPVIESPDSPPVPPSGTESGEDLPTSEDEPLDRDVLAQMPEDGKNFLQRGFLATVWGILTGRLIF